MKLATYKDGSRDGQLVVVSRDLARAHFATGIATRLQQVLDDWNFMAPQLQQLYEALNRGQVRHAFDFNPRLCAAPLPRAFQVAWAEAGPADGGNGNSGGDEDVPRPALRQLAGDALLGAGDVVPFASDDWDIDVEPGLAVITGDVAAGTPALQAGEGVRLLTLMSRWRLRALDGTDAAFAPAPAFGPVAVTPDELGLAWDGERVHAALQLTWNQRRLARRDAADALPWRFGELLARLAHTRMLQAGAIVGCAAASASGADGGELFSLQALRAHEAATPGAPRTGALRHGDRLRLELLDGERAPLGALEQGVAIGRG